MRIGIIGTGNVGGTLGSRWAQSGHDVIFGTREPQSDEIKQLLAKSGAKARASSVADAVAVSDVVVLATPWGAAKDVLGAIDNFNGKVLVDATNPLLPGLAGLELGTTTSAGEQVAQWARGARVVKSFNTVGFNIMAEPGFGAERPVLFYCGDDRDAKNTVKQLATELGFDAQDAGPLTQARLLEPFAMLWIGLANLYGYGREIGFKLLRR